MRIYLDFETRSRVDLKKEGLSPYARDNSTVLLCMAWAIDDADVELWLPGDEFPPELKHAIENGAEMHAHNASFERAIWSELCVRRLGWPEVGLRQWHCSAVQAAMSGLPRSLKGSAKALGLSVEKDDEGHRLMLKYTKPRKPTITDRSEWFNDPRELRRIYEYCQTDVVVERELIKRMPPVPPREQYVYWADQMINDRGIPVDVPMAQLVVEKLQGYFATLNEELKEITGGAVETGNQLDKMIDWLGSQGVDTDNLQAETIRTLLEDPPNDVVRRVLEIRQQMSRASTAKFTAILNRADADHRVRGAHLHYGAHTGRWAGKGVQTQNIPRGVLKAVEIDPVLTTIRQHGFAAVESIWGDVTETLSGVIRPMIRASRGKKLIACDFAAIEARVLAWLSGETLLLEDFRQGRDAYKSLASRIYHVPIDKVTKAQRQMGKQAVLGLGYGMGKRKFAETCQKYNIDVTEEFAAEVVDLYRSTYRRVRKFWYDCEGAAIRAMKAGVGAVNQYIWYKPTADKQWLSCRLPAGRSLYYYKPRVREEIVFEQPRDVLSHMHENSMTRQWERTKTYGGRLVENIVQAVARDLLVDAMFRLERAGYPVVMHVHDEAVVEVDDNFGSVEEVEAIMAAVPDWAGGCPVAAEGFEAERYRK